MSIICNISIVLHFSKFNKILYFYVDKYTIYGIIISGRETVKAINFTPQTLLFLRVGEVFCPKNTISGGVKAYEDY